MLGDTSSNHLNKHVLQLGRALVRRDTGICPGFVGVQCTKTGLLRIDRGGGTGFSTLEALAGGDGGDCGIVQAGVTGEHGGSVRVSLGRDDGEEGHGGSGENGGETHFWICVFLCFVVEGGESGLCLVI